jgi:hypothetical protein
LILVKPATVVKWHCTGFRIYWRRRSRSPGRPKTSDEIRDLIRRMSLANPLWGAPRIHGELLKLGIEVSQATVGRHLPRRPKAPSPTWRFLGNHMTDIAAVDMFLVVTCGAQNCGRRRSPGFVVDKSCALHSPSDGVSRRGGCFGFWSGPFRPRSAEGATDCRESLPTAAAVGASAKTRAAAPM